MSELTTSEYTTYVSQGSPLDGLFRNWADQYSVPFDEVERIFAEERQALSDIPITGRKSEPAYRLARAVVGRLKALA